MPAVARTNRAEIVDAARRVLDAGGPDAVTMSFVAAAVGIRGPSLYKHVGGRDHLMHLVAEAAVAELGDTLARAVRTQDDPAAALTSAGRAFRAWAHRVPHAYGLVFGALPEEQRASLETSTRAAEPMFTAVAALVDEGQVLPAARTVTAWVSGFVSMELAGAFRSGGDVDEAFEWGLQHVVRAVASAGAPGGSGVSGASSGVA